jgi:segregation and condensation protein A
MYAVKTEEFEGPFDLLLGMIEKRKFSVNSVSLSGISDQYLEYIKQLQNFPIEEVAAFVVVASTMMLIKSRSLMPTMELTMEEEESIEDLEERLRLYKRARQLAVHINRLFKKQPLFARESFKNIQIDFLEPKSLTKENIYTALKSLVERLPKKEVFPEVEVKKIISLEEKIKELSERVLRCLEMSFTDFASSDSGDKNEQKLDLIISFLAMLELTKQGLVMVNQEELFSNINISATK